MAYPLSAPRVESIFNAVQTSITNVQVFCSSVQQATSGGVGVEASVLLGLADACRTYRANFSAIAGNAPLLAQLVPYVQQQVAGGSAMSVQSEYTQLNVLCGNVLAAFGTDYPRDGGGILLDRTYSTANGRVYIKLTPAQLPNVMPAIAALLAALT